MNRADRLLTQLRARYRGQTAAAVRMADGARRRLSFLEAFRLCAVDQSVIDAVMENETGASLLRALTGGEHDFSAFGDFGDG